MTSTHLYDKQLIEKLENVASLTNEDILSVEEISRGHSLLSEVRGSLAHSNSGSMMQVQAYQSAFTLPEHAASLSVALVPQKELPFETLEQIFRSGSEGLGYVSLPPTLSEHRWVLGQVCSTWRRVSRSIPSFWKAVIEFNPQGYGVHHVRALKQLECAVDILPEIAQICLTVTNSKTAPARLLIPYLAYIKELKWANWKRKLIEVFPPGALSRLESLHVDEGEDICTNHTTPYIDLFGESSRLQHFSLSLSTFGAPTSLLSDIPWPQLQSFNLKLLYVRMNASWVQLAQHDPFRLMSSLEHLELNMAAAIFRIFLPCKFPWHRLKTLKIGCDQLGQDLAFIMKPLQNCTSLLTLEIVCGGILDEIAVDVEPISLPLLQTLRVHPGKLLSAVDFSSFSGTLRSLEAGSIPLREFYIIAAKCHCLTKYNSWLIYGKLAANFADFITLPHLTSLQISLDDLSSFPTAIMAPLLTCLSIYGPGPSSIVEMTVDFIVRSKMQLQSLELVLHQRVTVSPESLRELLAAVDSCHSVKIYGIIFPEQILDEIASGILIPYVEHLGIGSPNPGVFFAMVRNCLERQAELGRVILQEIYGLVPQTYRRLEERIAKLGLKELEERYGVRCAIHSIIM
ncbi:hypothetical protein C0995_002633 [Termitomyces sp. Mi166|nr:hypothetical protein C0995_002633 [Termitomyces sp. Mi166\